MKAVCDVSDAATSVYPQLWLSGRPDAPGWYPASVDRDPDIRRYWDGSRWSTPAYADDRIEVLARAKNTPGDPDDVIEFLDSSKVLQ